MNGKEKSVWCSCLPSDMKVCSEPLKQHEKPDEKKTFTYIHRTSLKSPVTHGFPSISSHLFMLCDLRIGIILFMLIQYKVTIICTTAPNN